MGYEAVKPATASVEATASAVALKAGLANISAGVAGTAVLFIFGARFVPGFLAGFLIGALNLYWLLKISRRIVTMPAEKAGRFVTISYYVRFALTAAAVGALVASGLVSPWPVVAGLSVSVFTTIASMVLIAREEALRNA